MTATYLAASRRFPRPGHLLCYDHWKAERDGRVLRCEKCGRHYEKSGACMCPPSVHAESPETLLSSTKIGEHFGISATRTNLILAELGWIEKYVKGWQVTEHGRQLGGICREARQTGHSLCCLAGHDPGEQGSGSVGGTDRLERHGWKGHVRALAVTSGPRIFWTGEGVGTIRRILVQGELAHRAQPETNTTAHQAKRWMSTSLSPWASREYAWLSDLRPWSCSCSTRSDVDEVVRRRVHVVPHHHRWHGGMRTMNRPGDEDYAIGFRARSR